jgi:hypothetical protein
VNERLMTDRLAERVHGWRAKPDRFMTGDRTWIARSQFRPFEEVSDALRLADKLTRRYSLSSTPDGFIAEVSYPGRVGRATARHKARALTLAIIQAMDLQCPVSGGPKLRLGGIR